MPLIRWDPFRDLVSLQERINKLFEDNILRTRSGVDAMDAGVWSPPVDIFETTESIVLKAELPGLDKKNIHIEVKDNVLTLTGERTFDKTIKEENYHRMERCYGSFIRSFTLPSSVDKDKVKARFKDGILEVSLPKSEKAKPKQITVEVQ